MEDEWNLEAMSPSHILESFATSSDDADGTFHFEPQERTDQTKLINRRKITSKSEKKRRDRINERMNELMAVIPKARGVSKLSKEGLLNYTLDYVRELQGELEELREFKRQRLAVGIPPQVSSCGEGDLLGLWNHLMGTYMKMWVNAKSLYSSSCLLEEVSSRLGSEECQLIAIITKERYFSVCNPDMEQRVLLTEKGISLYKSYQQKRQSTEPLLYDSLDMLTILLGARAANLMLMGKVDESQEWIKQCTEKAWETAAPPAKAIMMMGEFFHKVEIGETLSITEANLMKSFQCYATPWVRLLIEIGFGVSLVQNSRAKKDQMEGLAMVEKAVEEGVETIGLCFSTCVASMVLIAFLAAGLFEEGLKRADRFVAHWEECGAEGSSTIGEVYRLKGELLVGKMEKKRSFDEATVKEAEELFRLAVQTSIERGIKTNELKARISFVKFWQKMDQRDRLEQDNTWMKATLDSFENTVMTDQGIFEEARSLFEQVSLG